MHDKIVNGKDKTYFIDVPDGCEKFIAALIFANYFGLEKYNL